MITFFDVETTDKYDFKAQPDAAHQPRIVSLAAVCYSNDFVHELNSFYSVVKPDGFVINNESEACKVNGITQEFATVYGIPIQIPLHMLDHFVHNSDYVCSFNYQFDSAMIEREKIVYGKKNFLHPSKSRCIMLAMAGVMKEPGMYGDYKWPKLSAAWKYCFGQEMPPAHNSLVDTRCAAWITAHIVANGWWSFEQQALRN